MRSTWTRLLAALTIVAVLGVPTIGTPQNSPFPLTQTAVLQNAAVATGNGSIFNVSQFAAITVQTVIVTTATVVYESSNDNVNFVAQTCFSLDGQTSSTSTTSSTVVRCDVNGLLVFRARISSWGSGAVTVTANGTSNAMAVRDQIALSGAITGQLRGTQTPAPTCGTATTTQCIITGGGTDSFIRGAVSNPPNWKNTVVVTFAQTWASAPACVASWDGTKTYGYYIQAVSPTTTTVTLKLGGNFSQASPLSADVGWSPGDAFSVICGGTQ